MGEKFLPMMLHQLEGGLANDQVFPREGNKKRAAGFPLPLACLGDFVRIHFHERARRFRTIKVGIARSHEDDVSILRKKVDGIEMNEVFEESEEEQKPAEAPKAAVPAVGAAPAGESKPAEPPKEDKK